MCSDSFEAIKTMLVAKGLVIEVEAKLKFFNRKAPTLFKHTYILTAVFGFSKASRNYVLLLDYREIKTFLRITKTSENNN